MWESEEHRAKIGKPVVVDGVEFDSARKASRELNIPVTTVITRCNNPKLPNYVRLEKRIKNVK